MTDYIYVFTNKDTCPTGWTKESTWVGRGIYTAVASLKTTAGAYTHSHSVPTNKTASGSEYMNSNLNNYTIAPIQENRVLCKIDQLTFDSTNLKSFFIDAGDCPDGYDTIDSGYYVALGNSYSINNAATHTHDATVTQLYERDWSGGTDGAHSITGNTVTTSAANISAPYVTLKMCIKKGV